MFYDRFKELCDKKGVSPKRAVIEMGLSNSLATKWKKTGATPSTETLVKVAAYFEVSVEDLIDGKIRPISNALFHDNAANVATKEFETKTPAAEINSGLSEEERKFIEWYRHQASEKDKALVRMIVEGE